MVLGSHVLATLRQLYDFSTLKKYYEHHCDVANQVYSSTEEDPSELPKEVLPLEDLWAGASSRSATSLKNLSDKRLTQGGTLSFPSRAPLLTYILPSRDLAHNLWSVSALIGTNHRATFTPTSVSFFSPSSPLPFLTGTKQATDTLWALSLPTPSVSLLPSPTSLVASPCMHTHYDTAAPYNIFPGKCFLSQGVVRVAMYVYVRVAMYVYVYIATISGM